MLHIIRHSFSESESLKNCLTVYKPHDVLLLIENGVFCALSGTASGDQLAQLASQQSIFVLTPHATERGVLDRLIDETQLIDFEGFVDLVVQQYPVMYW